MPPPICTHENSVRSPAGRYPGRCGQAMTAGLDPNNDWMGMNRIWTWRGITLGLFVVGLGLILWRWQAEQGGQVIESSTPPAAAPESALAWPYRGNPSAIAAAFGDSAQNGTAQSLPQGSIHDLDGGWRSAGNRVVRLSATAGKRSVVTFFYTSCPDVCPVTLASIDKAFARLPADMQQNVGRMALSYDPARDTPSAMAALRDRLGLDPQRWTFLTPDNHSVLDSLIPLFGFSYLSTGDDFIHTELVAVVDESGRVVDRITNNISNPELLAERLRSALAQ